MRRSNIDQHLSREGTVYLHAFQKPSPSVTAAPSSARGARGTDVTLSTDPLTANAMIPSLSGA